MQTHNENYWRGYSDGLEVVAESVKRELYRAETKGDFDEGALLDVLNGAIHALNFNQIEVKESLRRIAERKLRDEDSVFSPITEELKAVLHAFEKGGLS